MTTQTQPRPFPGLTVTVPAATPANVTKAKRVALTSLAEQCTLRTARVVLRDTEVLLASFDGLTWTDTPEGLVTA